MADQPTGTGRALPRNFIPAGERRGGAGLLVRVDFWIALLLCIAVCTAVAVTNWPGISSSARRAFLPAPVFANGSHGYFCYRIPAIVQLPDGALLAFAEARRKDCDDFGDIQIVMRTSRDAGKHWSSMQVVASNGHLQTGNPAPIVDTMDPRYPQGRIFLFYTAADAPEDELMKGHGSEQVYYRTSVDGGATWAPPVDITGSVKLPSWGNYGTGEGHALQLGSGPHRGRILVPGYHTGNSPQSALTNAGPQSFFSDDHGQTWSLGATVKWPTASESTAAQAADGNVVMNSRDETGKARIVSISSTGGERWDKTFVAHDLPDPQCQGSLISYTATGKTPVLLFSNLLNTNPDRQGLAISESTDGGLTWPKHVVIEKGSSQYSDLVVMPGGKLGILWERWSDGILFATRPIDKLF